MNLINLRAVGGAYAPEDAPQDEDDAPPVITEAERSRAWERRRLHTLYRQTLTDYRDYTSDWSQNMTRRTLLNIWENYRATRHE